MRDCQRQSGVTLIELLVVIVILGILMGIAVPSFRDLIANGRLASETNDLISDLAFARAESGRRGKRVTLCYSANGTGCGTGSAWGGGRIIFVDSNTYGTVDAGDELLRVNQSALATNGITIAAAGFTVSSASTLNYVQFKPGGATSSDAGGVFKICDSRIGTYGRSVSVLATGRVSLSQNLVSCP